MAVETDGQGDVEDGLACDRELVGSPLQAQAGDVPAGRLADERGECAVEVKPRRPEVPGQRLQCELTVEVVLHVDQEGYDVRQLVACRLAAHDHHHGRRIRASQGPHNGP